MRPCAVAADASARRAVGLPVFAVSGNVFATARAKYAANIAFASSSSGQVGDRASTHLDAGFGRGSVKHACFGVGAAAGTRPAPSSCGVREGLLPVLRRVLRSQDRPLGRSIRRGSCPPGRAPWACMGKTGAKRPAAVERAARRPPAAMVHAMAGGESARRRAHAVHVTAAVARSPASGAVELRLRGDDEEGRAAARAETSPRAVGSARDGRKRLRGKGGGYEWSAVSGSIGEGAAGRLRFNVARPFERTHTSFAESVAATQSRGSSGPERRAERSKPRARSRASRPPPGRADRPGARRANPRQLFSPFPATATYAFFSTGYVNFEPEGLQPVRAENRSASQNRPAGESPPSFTPRARRRGGRRDGSDAWSPKRGLARSRPIHYDASKMPPPEGEARSCRYRRAVRGPPRARARRRCTPPRSWRTGKSACVLAHTAPDLPAVLREGEIETSSAGLRRPSSPPGDPASANGGDDRAASRTPTGTRPRAGDAASP